MVAISLQSVGKQFGKTEVIRNVNLSIEDGEFAVFVGPSGCGKSTMLRLIAGLEEVSSGIVRFDSEEVTELAPADRKVAMVFQSYALYPHMNVYNNMAFGLKLAKKGEKKGKKAIDERVREVAAVLQIESLLDRKPRELSGGQRQRVAIGRAIVRQPRVFLFDEPLSNLDAALRVQMRLELKRLHRQLGTTMIYVTHDQVEAMTLADRIVVLNGGKVEQIGTPLELYHQPQNRFVAGFIGSPKMNFLDAVVISCDGQSVTVDFGGDHNITALVADSGALQSGSTVTLGLRPEHLTKCDDPLGSPGDGQRLQGEIIAVEHLGSEAYVHITQGKAEPLVFKCAGDITVTVGKPIAVSVPKEACYLFDDTGVLLPRPA